jgi:site-specific recombinase XerD
MYASLAPSPRTRNVPATGPGTPGRLSRPAVTTKTAMAESRWADEIGLYRAIHRNTQSGKTIEGRLPSLRHAARYFGELGIAPQDVTRDQLIAYFDIEDERRRGAGPLAHWCNLRYFFDWLAREYDIPSPMARLKRPKAKHADAPHAFTAAERKAILAARAGKTYLDLRDTAIIRLLGASGLRRAELLAMRRGDLDGRDSAPVRCGKGEVVAFEAETSIAIRRHVRARDERFPGRHLPRL